MEPMEESGDVHNGHGRSDAEDVGVRGGFTNDTKVGEVGLEIGISLENLENILRVYVSNSIVVGGFNVFFQIFRAQNGMIIQGGSLTTHQNRFGEIGFDICFTSNKLGSNDHGCGL